MTRDDLIAYWGQVSFDYVEIGAADTTGPYLEADLAFTGDRRRMVLEEQWGLVYRSWLLQDLGAHLMLRWVEPPL